MPIDRIKLVADAEKRGCVPQWHDGEPPMEPDKEMWTEWLGATDERNWLRAAYAIISATWRQRTPPTVLDDAFQSYDAAYRAVSNEEDATVHLEAYVATLAAVNVPRAITHQIVRHRQFGFGQESFRITDLRQHSVWVPQSVRDNPHLVAQYRKLVSSIKSLYAEMVDAGISWEDARNIMPMGTTTYIVMTGNLRAWLGYFEARLQDAAQPEHQYLARLMLEQFDKHAPYVHRLIRRRLEK